MKKKCMAILTMTLTGFLWAPPPTAAGCLAQELAINLYYTNGAFQMAYQLEATYESMGCYQLE